MNKPQGDVSNLRLCFSPAQSDGRHPVKGKLDYEEFGQQEEHYLSDQNSWQ